MKTIIEPDKLGNINDSTVQTTNLNKSSDSSYISIGSFNQTESEREQVQKNLEQQCNVIDQTTEMIQDMVERERLLLMPSDVDEFLSEKDQEESKTVCKVKLQPKVTRLNLMSFFLLRFILKVIMTFVQTFISFILVDPDIYGVPKDQVGIVAGELASIGNIMNIFLNPFMSMLMDLKGRKVPVVVSYLIAGSSILMMPFFTTVIPAMIILRPLVQLGILAGGIAPIQIDYVDKNSIPIVIAQQLVFETIATALTSCIVLQLFSVETVEWVYHMIGGLVILGALFLIYGIRDIYREKILETRERSASLISRSSNSDITACERAKAILRRLLTTLKQEKSLPVSLIGSFASASIQVAINQFAILLILFQYKDNQDAQSFAKSYCSFMTLIAGFCTIPLYFAVNLIAKRIKYWRTGIILTVLMIIFEGFFVSRSWKMPASSLSAGDGGDVFQMTCLVLLLILSNLQFLVHISTTGLVAKMDASNRGMVTGLFALASSLGCFTMNLLGGEFFDRDNVYPFIMNICEYAILLIAFLIMGPRGKLRF